MNIFNVKLELVKTIVIKYLMKYFVLYNLKRSILFFLKNWAIF